MTNAGQAMTCRSCRLKISFSVPSFQPNRARKLSMAWGRKPCWRNSPRLVAPCRLLSLLLSGARIRLTWLNCGCLHPIALYIITCTIRQFQQAQPGWWPLVGCRSLYYIGYVQQDNSHFLTAGKCRNLSGLQDTTSHQLSQRDRMCNFLKGCYVHCHTLLHACPVTELNSHKAIGYTAVQGF